MHEAGIKVPEQPPAILREPEVRALLHVVDADRTFAGRRDAAILRLLIDTGARRAEVANLRWVPAESETNDVDLGSGLVRVLGKGRRERLLSIGSKTVKSLDRYLRVRESNAAAATPWLWLGLKGRLTDSGIAQMVADRGRAAALGEHLHPHLLRERRSRTALCACQGPAPRRDVAIVRGPSREPRFGHRVTRGPRLRAGSPPITNG